MSTTGSQPWMRGPGGRRGGRSASGDLRVSDAERHDVADRLSKHYADGRLDQDEFDERLHQAMSAKTQSDLRGLFVDLPATDGEDLPARRHRRSVPNLHNVLIVVLLLVLVSAVIHSVLWLSHFWVILGVLVAVVLLRHDLRWRHW